MVCTGARDLYAATCTDRVIGIYFFFVRYYYFFVFISFLYTWLHSLAAMFAALTELPKANLDYLHNSILCVGEVLRVLQFFRRSCADHFHLFICFNLKFLVKWSLSVSQKKNSKTNQSFFVALFCFEIFISSNWVVLISPSLMIDLPFDLSLSVSCSLLK